MKDIDLSSSGVTATNEDGAIIGMLFLTALICLVMVTLMASRRQTLPSK